MSEWEQRSTAQVVPPARPRALAKVPFVELADDRLQGVVSSGSDIARVYVSSITAGEHAYACSTNNNRPCGGLRGGLCKHLTTLVSEAIAQYGAEGVVRYLRIGLHEVPADPAGVIAALRGPASRAGTAAAAPVFARFLRHLRYLELPVSTEPAPELHWFLPAGVAC